jgi:uncharacterized protein
MFLLRAFKTDNFFWKYIVGSILIILASSIGQIPLLIGVAIKVFSEGKSFPTAQDDLMKVLDKNLTLFLLLFSFLVAFIGIYLVARFLHKQTIHDITTTRSKVDWNRILFSFALWGIFQAVVIYIDYYQNPQNYILNFHPTQFVILAVIAIVMIPIQTSVEEFVFRGYLMQGFGLLAKNKWFPLVMTSVIFGSMHLANPEVVKMGYITMVYYIGTGFFLGILVLMDEGLELSLGFHAANNLIGALLVTSDWSAFQTDSVLKDISNPTAGFEIVFPVVVIFPIILFIFSKKYKWSNWKEKLIGELEVVSQEVEVNDIN